jgi:hypothetical protein
MRSVLAIIGLLFLLQVSTPVRADSADDEIAYLLGFIRQSSCTFIRNGSEYDGPAAADHVSEKYQHFKREIHTAEDFIDRSATKSLLSGEPYAVRCGTAPQIAAADWLRGALQAYRAQHAPAGTQ